MSDCRNGHALSKAGMVWTGTHYQCRTCRLRSVREANERYFSTAKGLLAKVRGIAAARKGT